MYKKSSKSVGALVSISLLLVVSVIVFFQVNSWFSIYKSDIEVEIASGDIQRNIEIVKVEGTKVFLNNKYKDELTINSIKIANKSCPIGSSTIDKGLAIIDVGSCTRGFENLTSYSVALLTDFGVKEENQLLRNIISGPFIVSFQSSTCDFSSGYIKLYGMSSFDNAHAELGNSSAYSYNVCIRHLDYTLSLGGGSNSQILFSLINESNSQVFINKTSVYQAPSNWNDIEFSTSSGSISYQVGGTRPNSNYQCVGGLDIDDVRGSHSANCNSVSFTDLLWVSVE